MDSTYITAVRIGLTGALAAHRLAQGLPFQDLVVAWQVYNAALAQGLGRKIDFLA